MPPRVKLSLMTIHTYVTTETLPSDKTPWPIPNLAIYHEKQGIKNIEIIPKWIFPTIDGLRPWGTSG